MTGGEAFIYDPAALLTARLNTALVEAQLPASEHLEQLRWLVERHVELTGSTTAKAIMDNWSTALEHLWRVAPIGRVQRIEAHSAGRVGAST